MKGSLLVGGPFIRPGGVGIRNPFQPLGLHRGI